MTMSRTTQFGFYLLFGAASNSAAAAGYALIEQSITGLGRAFSGSAAVADDASTIFFNPAGMTNLSRKEMNMGLNLIAPRAEFSDRGSNVNGTPLTGGDGSNAGELAAVPNFYYAHPLNDKTVVGIGVGAPFGLVTDYGDSWQGRYHAIRSDLLTLNINPSIAFKVTEKLSLGFGVNLQYIDLELSQAANFGSFLGNSQGNDGRVKVTADDWSWGYNLGMTYQFTEATRMGLSYRSKITHDLTGEGEFRIPENVNTQATAAGFQDGNVGGRVTLPESASIALVHQLNSQWSVMADASWTRWSRFEELQINSDVSRLNTLKEEDWENSMRYGLGVEYKANDRWSWRAGVAYDETPIPNAQRRTPRIPDSDRTWLALGASYHYSDNIILDAAYTHIFMKDSSIEDTFTSGTQTYELSGKYKSSVDIVGVQLRWLFD
ncbi:OmpP1/FadL family transporter [Methylophaga nitratireducenticrescens]|uniref:Long-chain fatty acid transport protein n=1 Tax=Methylophaga nitratireducenticrescens TaxID=754476 RepID=I1XKT4_METNJ|nr:outer membrane protein transport protein [Methylophaga nitratireducenticrescens]AFI85003.1 long-chain fatty acid transporter [Methylophaga nitratireducenticrescens]AUZ85011.1 long-chain fatty acid transporter [Methylophaga nitratireducenticrescens]